MSSSCAPTLATWDFPPRPLMIHSSTSSCPNLRSSTMPRRRRLFYVALTRATMDGFNTCRPGATIRLRARTSGGSAVRVRCSPPRPALPHTGAESAAAGCWPGHQEKGGPISPANTCAIAAKRCRHAMPAAMICRSRTERVGAGWSAAAVPGSRLPELHRRLAGGAQGTPRRFLGCVKYPNCNGKRRL